MQLQAFAAVDSALFDSLRDEEADVTQTLRSLEFTEEQVGEAVEAYQADMVFSECKDYIEGQAPLEAVFSLMKDAILSKGGIVDNIDDFRAEMSDYLQVGILLGE